MSSAVLVQLTTVHPRGDTRILYRQMHALAQRAEWSAALVVGDGKGSNIQDVAGVPVRIVDVGRPTRGGRLARATIGAWRMFREARRLRADVVHFHDPELIPVGLALRCFGVKVVYDVHEDTPRQILHKHWLPQFARVPAAWIMEMLESIGAHVFDAIVCATPTIAARFPPHKTIVVQNFPIAAELAVADPKPYHGRANTFVYVGAIAVIRGAKELIEAVELVASAYEDVRIDLAGSFAPQSLHDELRSMAGWSRATYHGWAPRQQVAKLLGDARAGLVVLHPTVNYQDAYPVKMFEYMAAGLPVIASAFPLWRRIVEGARCGLLVDPTDPANIAEAMRWILMHPDEAREMGRRGALAVHDTYNWRREADKLVGLYTRLARRGADQ